MDETVPTTPRPDEPAMPEREGGEIDVAALQATKQRTSEQLEAKKAPKPWEREDAPPGSTSGSLMVYRGGEPVRVSGPTHYHHLADGRVLAHYNGGTEYSEPGENGGPDKITRVVAIHEGS